MREIGYTEWAVSYWLDFTREFGRNAACESASDLIVYIHMYIHTGAQWQREIQT